MLSVQGLEFSSMYPWEDSAPGGTTTFMKTRCQVVEGGGGNKLRTPQVGCWGLRPSTLGSDVQQLTHYTQLNLF